MDKYKSFLQKLRELKKPEKAENTIKLLEAINSETPELEKREAAEQAIDLIEADHTFNDIREILRTELKAKFNQEFGPYILDFSVDFVIYELEDNQPWRASYVIDNGKVVFGDPVKVIQRTIYEIVTEAKKDKNGQFDMFQKETKKPITGDYIQLVEAALSEDGTIPIKIIEPGWGSSGYYSEEVLQRDAGIYKEGTKMYWNHPTASEEIERPERSLNDLAGVIVTEGVYNADGAQGPGVYAQAKVFSQYQDMVSSMYSDIGLSHVALGTANPGEAEGEKGIIIESLNVAQSVDFVTQEGAGGKIVELFESARNIKSIKKPIIMAENKELDQLKESNNALTDKLKILQERALLSDAAELVSNELNDTKNDALHQVTKARLKESLVKEAVADKDGNLDKIKFQDSMTKAIKVECDYLAKLMDSGQIKGMGEYEQHEQSNDQLKESDKQSWEALGFDEKQVGTLVKGRI